MPTPTRGYLAALLGSVLGAVLLGWFGAVLVATTNRPDPNVPSTVGPILAAVFAVFGLGWLGTGLGCALALRLRRATAIGATAGLVLVLAPIAAVLHFNLLFAAPLFIFLIELGAAALFARWLALRLGQHAARRTINA